MNHQAPDITPLDLGDHPEIAVLLVLDSALATAKLAIIAVHPELNDADPAVVPSNLEALAADHVLTAADGLRRAIASYRALVTRDVHWTQFTLPGLASPSF
jgi:hypothetical protein